SFVATLNGDHYKASLRSVAGFNLLDAIARHQELFLNYGGHQQALGLSYEPKNSKAIKKALQGFLKPLQINQEYQVIKANSSDLNIENIKSLRYLEPFGQDFNKPLFIIEKAIVAHVKTLSGHNYKVSILVENNTFEVLMFNQIDQPVIINDIINIICSVGINYYRNQEQLNIIMEAFKKV
ncbi:MAG: DHHA1 domain-containing protein, partial [Bacilli bacterium]